MTLMEKLRRLRTDPMVMAWVEDGDVMWLPYERGGRIAVPFYAMEKGTDAVFLKRTSAEMELSWPQLRILKLERSDGGCREGEGFWINSRDSLRCRELAARYHGYLDQYLGTGDASALEKAKECEKELYSLVRRAQ